MDRPLVGLMYRQELARDVRDAGREIDFLEVTAEHFLGPAAAYARVAEELSRRWPLLVHGLDLSLGTAADPEARATRERQDLVRRLGAAAFSEHASFTRVPGRAVGCLSPLPFCEAAVEAIARRAEALQEGLGVPLRLENIAYYFRPPGDEVTEVQFLRALLDRTGAEALLDLNNLHANATNFGYDAEAFLDAFPLDRVTEVHLAGGDWHGESFIDTHGAAPGPEVMGLLEMVASRAPLRHVTLEWDHSFPPFERIVEVLRDARSRVTRAEEVAR